MGRYVLYLNLKRIENIFQTMRETYDLNFLNFVAYHPLLSYTREISISVDNRRKPLSIQNFDIVYIIALRTGF